MSAAPGTATVHKGVAWKTILIIALLITALSILAALPISFFMNGNQGDWFGNIPLDKIPLPDQPPPTIPEGNWEIPDFNEIPEGWEDWVLPPGFELPDGFDGCCPEGEIPWWLVAGAMAGLLLNGSLPGGGGVGDDGGVGGLPGMGGSMGTGMGPFGSGSTCVYVSNSTPWRYWRMGCYDYYEGATWLKTDNSTNTYTPDSSAGTDYTVKIMVIFSQAGYGTLPLPSLWNHPMIRPGLQVLNSLEQPAVNLTWTLLEDQYGTVHWNASVGIPDLYYINYNITCDNMVNVSAIESNVNSQSPLSGLLVVPPDGYDYLQIPDLSGYPEVVADIQSLANNPTIATYDTLETALAVMEYFKTRWWWTPYRMLTPGQEFDPGWLINNGYGVSADFASNYVMYLRSLNISSRLVWGGLGWQNETIEKPRMAKLTHSHFWAEVWIPNETNTGGEWLQIDPNPLPPTMWQTDQSVPSSPDPILIPVNMRRNDTRVKTSHYTMFLESNSGNVPQNPETDLFNLNGTLVRDGKAITKTWLNETVLYTYTDVTENLLIAANFSGVYSNHNFSATAIVGPHRFNASFHAVVNETIIACNGITSINIQSLNPNSIIRGTGDAFIVDANISDDNGKPEKDVELQGYIQIINQNLTDNYGRQLTDVNGEVTSNYSFPSNQPEGVYNFTMRFNGTFTVNYPDPFPDVLVTVPAASAQSQNETIIVTSTLYLNLTSPTNSILPREHMIEFSGYLTYDNLTPINNGLVTIWWTNSTGIYNLSADYTNPSGFYQTYHYVPKDYNDPVRNNDVRIWANFTVVWGNATTDPSAIYHVRCSNQTNITLNTDLSSYTYILRGSTLIHVWGSFTSATASTANQEVSIIISETSQFVVNVTTDASGNYNKYFQIPDDHPPGIYNLSAEFAGIWRFGAESIYIPSSNSSNPWNPANEFILIASTVLTKTANPTNLGRIVSPSPIIAGDNVSVSGYLLFENGTRFGAQEVQAWWIEQDGTEIPMGLDTTNGSGYYSIIYATGVTQPTDVDIKVNYSAGALMTSFILNASTFQDPEVKWAVNISINSITPGEISRGQTAVNIMGRIVEKHGWNVSNEQVYVNFDGARVRDQSGSIVGDITNDTGYFQFSFIVPSNYPIKNYTVSAEVTNPSFIINSESSRYLEVNTTTQIIGLAIDRTGFLNETITLSGRLVDNLGQDFAGTLTFKVDNNQTMKWTQPVTGTFNIPLILDPVYVGTGLHNISIQHNQTALAYFSNASISWTIPRGANVTINSIGGYTNLVDLTIDAGSTITISGILKDNSSDYRIKNRLVEVYFNNVSRGTAYTNLNGEFEIEITVPSMEGNATIHVNFTVNNNTYESQTITVAVIIQPGIGGLILRYLPWIIGIVAGIIVVLVARSLYHRRGEKAKKAKLAKFTGIDIESINLKLEALKQGKRFREAIIFAYYTFLKLMEDYFGRPKPPSQTARDYSMKVAVKKVKIPPTIIYPFTNLFEDARYGNKPITEYHLNDAIKLFMNLLDRIIETPRELAKEANSEEAEA